MDHRIVMVLSGSFCVTDDTGRNLAPRGAKAQGLLALLATAPSLRRNRAWLQDKLWSDRGREQGAASLRQVLSEIRRALGPAALVADRSTVGLDPRIVRIEPRDDAAGEFLEGIDVRDPEFEDWLRCQRVAAPQTVRRPGPPPDAALRRRPAVAFLCASAPGTPARLFEDLFADVVARSLAEALSVDVTDTALRAGGGAALQVTMQAYDAEDGQSGLRVRLTQGEGGILSWSGMRRVRARGGPPVEEPDILSLANQLIDAVADVLLLQAQGRPERRDANILGRLAIRRIFSMEPEQLVEADRLLVAAHEQDPRAIWLSWRAQLRVIQEVERHGLETGLLREEAAALVRAALTDEPGNSVVLATAANARLVLEDDVAACHDLALRSVEMNPASPLAWDALSNAKLYRGEAEAAHVLAVKAQRLGSAAPHRFWWDMGRCLTAALTGRADEAVRMAEASSALAPNFRPPLRYLTGLYARDGRLEDARRTGARLARMEPDFSADRLLRDETYPVGVLRRSGLLDAARLRDVGV